MAMTKNEINRRKAWIITQLRYATNKGDVTKIEKLLNERDELRKQEEAMLEAEQKKQEDLEIELSNFDWRGGDE